MLRPLTELRQYGYIEQIIAEMSKTLPDLNIQKLESGALCVSNAMNSLARTLYGQRKDAVVSNDNCSLCNSDPKKSQCDTENVILKLKAQN